jgi:hypothetical protein
MTTPSRPREWRPQPTPPEDDPLLFQADQREHERLLRDPEFDAPPTVVKVSNRDDPGIVPVDPHPSQVEGRNR